MSWLILKRQVDHDWNRVRLAGETAGDLLYQHGDIQGWKLEDSHYELYEKFRKLEQDDLPIWTKPADSWYHISSERFFERVSKSKA